MIIKPIQGIKLKLIAVDLCVSTHHLRKALFGRIYIITYIHVVIISVAV